MYDDFAAKREGWAVFECDDGVLRIQRLDCPRDADDSLPNDPVFESNVAAIEFVRRHADSSAMHRAALALHESVVWR